VEFGTVIGIGRSRGLADDLIGGLCIAEIDELAAEHATLTIATSPSPSRFAERIAALKSFAPMSRSMRAMWSARVNASWNESSTAASISADSFADRHTARTSRSAPARSPSPISTRASASRPTALTGSPSTKPRTVAASARVHHSLPSARRRSSGMLGQSGLSRMKRA
jgi:hypothetical protein